MSKAAVRAIKIFENFADTGLKGRMTQKFFSGLLKLIHPRKKKALENLELAYPQSPEQWRKDICSSMYENLAWTMTEILALHREPSQILDWVTNLINPEILEDVLKSGKGVIFMSGHFGNWEIMASWYAQYMKKLGRKMYTIVQEIHDRDIAEYIDSLRTYTGINILPSTMSVQKYVRLLKDGGHVTLLNDVAGTGKMIVPFMGHDATNMPGPAIMSLLSGAPIIPVCIYRKAPFEHEIEFFQPIEFPDSNLDREERIRKVILDCNLAIETFIRKRPELWFWLHNRWKRRS